MKRKSFCLFFFTMIFATIFLSSSYTYGFPSKTNDIETFKVTLDKDIYKLDLAKYLESPLYPGAKLQAKFNITNDTNKKIELKTIAFENLSIIDISTNTKLDTINPRFLSFSEKISLNFKHKDISLFNIPLSQIINKHEFKLDKNLIFTSGSGSEFTFELFMNNTAGNEVQNLRGDFDIIFNFAEYYVAPGPDPKPDPTTTQGPDPAPNPTTTPSPNPEANPTTTPSPYPDPNPTTIPSSDPDPNPTTIPSPDPHPATTTTTTTNPKPDTNANTDTKIEPKTIHHLNTIIIDEKLIQTGSFFDYTTLSIISLLLIASGIILIYFKRKH